VTELYGRETDTVYYDVTNYYFEIDIADDLRKEGYSKENRRSPIVQMGLLLDGAGLPISYKLFPGNTHDSQTLMPVLKEVKTAYNAGRVVVVADKGLNSGDNIAFNTILGDGYIYSKSVMGASTEFKAWVLDGAGYRENADKFKMKSRIVPDAVIEVTVEQTGKKKKKKVMIEQKWIVFHSAKYAARAKRKRDKVIAKAAKMIENPAKYRSSFDYGAAGYIENLKINKDTGEIINIEDTLILNMDKVKDEERYDGYYAIVTSELDDPDEHVIETYRGLWRIEETFKVTKSVLGARPVFLRTMAHINAHFLTCFVTLLIVRILEAGLKHKYTIERIVDSLKQVACSNLDQNIWLFDYVDDVTVDIGDVFGIDFGKKVMTLSEIRCVLGDTKK
jgi:transposase